MSMTMTRRDLAKLGLGLGAAAALGRNAFAQTPAFFRIGTGGTAGTYYPVGGLIANAISNPPQLVLTAQASNGSVANVNSIVSGALESGFSQADVAYWAYSGTGLFEGKGKMEDLRLIANLYPESIHLVAAKSANIKSVADLKGKRIATTTGTTAHVFLDTALRANGVDPKDVELLNQRMPDAVTSFISGAVPAVALWVPFNITVRDKVPGAKKLVDAGAFYPKAAIVGGWAARNDYYEQNREVCARLVKGWVEANDYFIANPDAALTSLQKNNYSQVPIGDLREQYAAQKMFTSAEWKKLYADGTVTTWLQQVTDFFASVANIPSPVPASTYFDPKLFLSTAGA